MERVTRFSLGVLLLADVFSAVRVTQDQFVAVPPGDPVEMKCEQDDSSFLYLYWYRQYRGAGLALVGTSVRGSDPTLEEAFKHGYEVTRPDALRSTLKILAGAANHSATYFCATSRGTDKLHFGQGTKLTVLEHGLNITAPKVALFDPSPQEVKERGSATLVCLATNFYPDHVVLSWSVNRVERTEGVKTDDQPTRGSDKMYSLSSRLRISKKEWMNPQTTFSCRVYFDPEKQNVREGYSDCCTTKGREGCGGVTAESYRKSANTAKFTYVLLITKSAFYGLLVTLIAWKIKLNSGKNFS